MNHNFESPEYLFSVSPQQELESIDMRRQWSVVGLIIGVVCLILGLSLDLMWLIGAILIPAAGVSLSISFQDSKVTKSKVLSVTGEPTTSERTYDSWDSEVTDYWLKVGGKTFEINQSLFNSLNRRLVTGDSVVVEYRSRSVSAGHYKPIFIRRHTAEGKDQG